MHIERSSWLDPGHDHGDGVTLRIIVEKSFTDHACPNITYITEVISMHANTHVPRGLLTFGPEFRGQDGG
jgi:hypothetical protein